ncbi:MAG: hypothetical protein HY606_08045 [Planctomycetes bacterium]|nr:hypothetical protein [Planctomycetota bacterium]
MATALIKGEFYNTLTENRKDSADLKSKMEEAVQKFLEHETNMNKPGMLLGKIQSGKTRAFIGIIALAFDNNYDMVIILTKGTKALARQTYARLKKDFHDFIDYDMIKLYDILNIPADRLPGYILKQKLIMIVKKETNNLERTIRTMVETYPDLSKRKVLIIDDEADFASIGFTKNRKEGIIELRTIASQIDELRKKVEKSDFLEVTATPYSLYLQPDNLTIPSGVFKPTRPAFTVLLPIYKAYIGGDFFFKEGRDEKSIAHYVYEEVPTEELDALRKPNRKVFKIEECLTHKRIETLRRGILNFIVGACIRRIQQRQLHKRPEKYSFVVHTEQGKEAHDWQVEVVSELNKLLIYSANHNLPKLSELVRESYDDLSKSVSIISPPPTYDEVFNEVLAALKGDYLMITKVNSDAVVEQLLDDNGELELSAPLNVFIGGQILDRGITIRNFIGFYYGRRPSKFQQDTVLQHSRIFGNRPKEDLAVTRFYTAFAIYTALEKINEFDNALREAFEKEAQPGVVFICKDLSNKILPCSPNKISISSTTTLTPNKRMLPLYFQTDYKTNIRSNLEELDGIITSKIPTDDKSKPFLIELSLAQSIIDKIKGMLIFEQNWDVKAFKACMEYFSNNTQNRENAGKVWCLVRRDRNASRYRIEFQRFEDRPDTEQDLADGKFIAKDIPALILLRQNGLEEKGWRGSSFWWPVMVAPQNIRPVIFASELFDVD